MPSGSHYRKWATQVARQAGEEPDDAEARRLLSIAEYFAELAEREESEAAANVLCGTSTGLGRTSADMTEPLSRTD